MPLRNPFVQTGRMTSSILDITVSCPSVFVAYCVMDLNKFRNDCSRLAERFSVVMVDARLKLSSNLLCLVLIADVGDGETSSNSSIVSKLLSSSSNSIFKK